MATLLKEKLESLAKAPVGSANAHQIITSLELLFKENSTIEMEAPDRLKDLVKNGDSNAKQNGMLALAILGDIGSSNQFKSKLVDLMHEYPLPEPYYIAMQRPHETYDTIKKEVTHWKAMLTTNIERKYKPSGKTTLRAIGLMSLAILAAPFIGGLMAIAGILFEKLFSFLFSHFSFVGGGIFSWIKTFLIGIFAYLGSYVGTACIIGKIEAEAGKKGNNRNIYIPMLLGIIATFMGTFALDQTKHWIIEAERSNITLLLGYVLAPVAAAITSTVIIYKQKFCEECNTYLKENRSFRLPLSIGKDLAKLIDSRAFSRLNELLTRPTDDLSKYCFLSLQSCPNCSNGFLEAHANIVSWWKKNGLHNLNKSEDKWMFRSIKVSSSEVAIVKPLLV